MKFNKKITQKIVITILMITLILFAFNENTYTKVAKDNVLI